MKTKHQVFFTVFMLCLFIITPIFMENEGAALFWISLPFSSLETMKVWYPNYGFYLWILKSIILIFSILLSLYLIIYFNEKIKVYIQTTFILVIYFFLAVLFEGHHPFTMIKMYSFLNDEVFVFYVDDCNEKIIPLENITDKKGAELSHLYYNLDLDKRINKNEIGQLMWEQLNVSQSLNSCLCLQKAQISDSNQFQKNNILLYEKCN